jgi:hypothetical protein
MSAAKFIALCTLVVLMSPHSRSTVAGLGASHARPRGALVACKETPPPRSTFGSLHPFFVVQRRGDKGGHVPNNQILAVDIRLEPVQAASELLAVARHCFSHR